MFSMNSEHLISISDAFSAFVYWYCHLAHVLTVRCTPNKSAPTLRYIRRPGPIYTGHACRHLPSAVPWISEDCLLIYNAHSGTNPKMVTSRHDQAVTKPQQLCVHTCVSVNISCKSKCHASFSHCVKMSESNENVC